MAAFIGFTISAGRTFDHFERHFIRTLAINAIVVLFACLVPGALADAYPRVFLKVSMGIFFLAGVVAATLAAIDLIKSWKGEEDDPFWWHAVGWLFGIMTFVFLFLGYANPEKAGAFYKLAATTLFGVPVWCFIAIVFRRFFR